MTLRSLAVVGWLAYGGLTSAQAQMHVATSAPSQVQPGAPDEQTQRPAQTPPPASQRQDYPIGVGDAIRVDVLDHRDEFASGDYLVHADGMVTLPLVGPFKVLGMTVGEVAVTLTKRLEDGHFLTNANVSVIMAGYHSQTITVNGEVRNQGTFILGSDQMTLQRAIQTAGGTTPDADSTVKIQRTRPQPSGPTSGPIRSGKDAVDEFQVNLKDLTEGKIADPPLVDKDLIIVLKAKQVYVNGQILRPGAQRWDPGLTLAKALQNAGGWTEVSAKDRVTVTRTVNDRQVKKTYNQHAQLTFLLQPEDIIDVPKKYF